MTDVITPKDLKSQGITIKAELHVDNDAFPKEVSNYYVAKDRLNVIVDEGDDLNSVIETCRHHINRRDEFNRGPFA